MKEEETERVCESGKEKETDIVKEEEFSSTFVYRLLIIEF